MAIVSGDWSVDNATGNIRYIGDDHVGVSPSYATVIELHRWLQDLADDASFTGDDELDISVETPSDRSTDNIVTLINGFNIDDAASEHLYDGSIIQAGGDTIYDGLVVIGNSANVQIIQNGAVLTDDWWNNDPASAGFGLNSDSNAGISHRFMLKVRDAAADIDGRRIVGTLRNYGKTYTEFPINTGTSRGNNVLALSEADDLNNQTASGTVATWDQFANDNQGYFSQDVSNDGTDENYYSNWDIGGGTTPASPTINDLYEYAKYITREGSASTLYGLNGELFRGITHEITVDTPTGTFSAFEAVSWSGGTGQMLAIDSTTAATKMWIQLLTGVAPTDGQTITGGTSSATVAVNVTVTERSISTPFIGASTGSAIIGAYGINVDSADLTASDTLFDLTNTAINPPNNVTFTVSGLVSGEDRVLVGPEDGSGGLDLDQMALNATYSGAAVTSIQMTAAIPVDTPASGTIRVQRDSGVYSLISYTSYTSDTFTIASTDFSTDNATTGNFAFVSYIDKLAGATSESFTTVFNASRTLFVRVRDGGGTPIKTFETTGTLGSSGGSSTAIRTADS